MVTDSILNAVEKVIEQFENPEKIHVGDCIWNMLSEFDEDKWCQMDDEQKGKWIENFVKKYVKTVCNECSLEFDGKIEVDNLGAYCICPNCLAICDLSK